MVDPDAKLSELAQTEHARPLLRRNGQPAEWPPETETRDGHEVRRRDGVATPP